LGRVAAGLKIERKNAAGTKIAADGMLLRRSTGAECSRRRP
jgi:hypothetical protein